MMPACVSLLLMILSLLVGVLGAEIALLCQDDLPPAVRPDDKSIRVEDDEAALDVWLDVVKSSFESEKEKKRSFESRAGVLLGVLSAALAPLLKTVSFSSAIRICGDFRALKTACCFAVYACLAFSVRLTGFAIGVSGRQIFDVRNICDDWISWPKGFAIRFIMRNKCRVVADFMEDNEKRAGAFKAAMLGVFVMLCSVALYFSD